MLNYFKSKIKVFTEKSYYYLNLLSMSLNLHSNKITKDEAMKILNITPDQLNTTNIIKQTENLIKMNDHSKGGSFYIQNKLYHSYIALINNCNDAKEKKEYYKILKNSYNTNDKYLKNLNLKI